MSLIEIKNVSKNFLKRIPEPNKFKSFFRPKTELFQALKTTNLTISQGEIFTLLGPNGAGKTTLIKILCGLISPTTGAVTLKGEPIENAKQKIGLMLGFSMIYYRLTGYDNLKYFAKLYHIQNYKKRIQELADQLDLGDWMDEYVEHYSTGMKSKLALARALIHEPEVIILDEPTAGVDPAMALEIRKKIREMGKTVFLTTHNMAEAQYLASTIALLNHGEIQAMGPFSEIKKRWNGGLEEAFLQFLGRKQA